MGLTSEICEIMHATSYESLGDECVAHLTGQGEAVTAAAGDAVARRLLGGRRGAIGAFVEVQQHRARIGGWRHNGRRLCLGRPGQAAAGEGETGTGQLQEVATGGRQGHRGRFRKGDRRTLALVVSAGKGVCSVSNHARPLLAASPAWPGSTRCCAQAR